MGIKNLLSRLCEKTEQEEENGMDDPKFPRECVFEELTECQYHYTMGPNGCNTGNIIIYSRAQVEEAAKYIINNSQEPRPTQEELVEEIIYHIRTSLAQHHGLCDSDGWILAKYRLPGFTTEYAIVSVDPTLGSDYQNRGDVEVEFERAS